MGKKVETHTARPETRGQPQIFLNGARECIVSFPLVSLRSFSCLPPTVVVGVMLYDCPWVFGGQRSRSRKCCAVGVDGQTDECPKHVSSARCTRQQLCSQFTRVKPDIFCVVSSCFLLVCDNNDFIGIIININPRCLGSQRFRTVRIRRLIINLQGCNRR